jgi:hypothetical protein
MSSRADRRRFPVRVRIRERHAYVQLRRWRLRQSSSLPPLPVIALLLTGHVRMSRSSQSRLLRGFTVQ